MDNSDRRPVSAVGGGKDYITCTSGDRVFKDKHDVVTNAGACQSVNG